MKERISWRQKIFARVWVRQSGAADEALRPLKQELFARAHGTVVELGPGTGANFRYFPHDISWVGIEPIEAWHAGLLAHPARPRSMRFASSLAEVPAQSADAVVSSLVLCSVPNVRATLAEVRRVLKPGGAFLCIEHIAAPRGSPRRLLQHLIRPLTWACGGGCNPVRDIGESIASAGFSSHSITLHRLPLGPLPFLVPIISCRAQK